MANKMTAGSSAMLRRDCGTAEWRIMALLAIRNVASPQQTSLEIGMDTGAVSRSIKVLQDAGLIVITPLPSNVRNLEVSLSPGGHRLHDRIVQVVFEREMKQTSRLAPEEIPVLLDMLGRVGEGIKWM